jgi:hypothetical protein
LGLHYLSKPATFRKYGFSKFPPKELQGSEEDAKATCTCVDTVPNVLITLLSPENLLVFPIETYLAFP